VSTSPTTIDGIVALAEYYRDVTLLSQGSEEPDSLEDAEDGIAKSGARRRFHPIDTQTANWRFA
jgi:hypothetical protein